MREFLTELRKVESLSVNVDSLAAHLQKLNGVATELGNARDSLTTFVTTLKIVIDTAAKITPPPTKVGTGWFGSIKSQ